MIKDQKIIVQVNDNQSDSNIDNEDSTNTGSVDDNPHTNPYSSFKKYILKLICQCLTWQKKQNNAYSSFTSNKGVSIPSQMGNMIGRKTLVLDLDETLVHSSFTPIPDPDFKFNLYLQGVYYTVYVKIRPGAFEFIRFLAHDYEIFIYTASLREYADPVIDYLDTEKNVSVRLFRENCTFYEQVYVKDLSNLNRDIQNIIIIDNSANSFMFQPSNAIKIRNYYDDRNDQELYFLIPFLKVIKDFQDIRPVSEYWYKFVNFQIINYVNVNGQSVSYQLREEDIDEIEEEFEQEGKKTTQRPQTNQKNICNVHNKELENLSSMEDLEIEDAKNQSNFDIPENNLPSSLQTPKEEGSNLLEKKQFAFKYENPIENKLNRTLVQRKKDYLADLEERSGINTEGADNAYFDKHNEQSELELKLREKVNSPKDFGTAKIRFPQQSISK